MIELLVVLALLGLVLAGVYSLLLWSYRTFYGGSDKAKLHYNLNLASEIIRDEIRFATSLSLLDRWSDLPSSPEEVMPGEHFLYYSPEDGAVILLDKNSSRQVGHPVITSVTFQLEDNSFYYKLEASERDSIFALESTVLLLNTIHPITPEDPLPALRYTKP